MSVFLVGELEAANGAGDAGGSPAVDRIASRLALRIQVHVVRSVLRSALAEINEGSPAIGQTNQHESAAADITALKDA